MAHHALATRDMLHNISRELLLPPVVKLGRLRAAMPGQEMHVIERHAFRQWISDRR